MPQMLVALNLPQLPKSSECSQNIDTLAVAENPTWLTVKVCGFLQPNNIKTTMNEKRMLYIKSGFQHTREWCTFGTDPVWTLLIKLQSTKPLLKQETNSLSEGWLDIPNGPMKHSNQWVAWYRLKATNTMKIPHESHLSQKGKILQQQ